MTTDTVSRETNTEYVAYLSFDRVEWQESYSFTDGAGKALGVLHENFLAYLRAAYTENVDECCVQVDGGFNKGSEITVSGTYTLTTANEEGEPVVSQEAFSSKTTLDMTLAAEPAYMPVSDSLLEDTKNIWIEMESDGDSHKALWHFKHSLAVSDLKVSVTVSDDVVPQIPPSPSAARSR
jgi:hypothetical protein